MPSNSSSAASDWPTARPAAKTVAGGASARALWATSRATAMSFRSSLVVTVFLAQAIDAC